MIPDVSPMDTISPITSVSIFYFIDYQDPSVSISELFHYLSTLHVFVIDNIWMKYSHFFRPAARCSFPAAISRSFANWQCIVGRCQLRLCTCWHFERYGSPICTYINSVILTFYRSMQFKKNATFVLKNYTTSLCFYLQPLRVWNQQTFGTFLCNNT